MITRKRFLQALVAVAGFLKLPVPAAAQRLFVDDVPVPPMLQAQADRILGKHAGWSAEFTCDPMPGMEVGQELSMDWNGQNRFGWITGISPAAEGRLRVMVEG